MNKEKEKYGFSHGSRSLAKEIFTSGPSKRLLKNENKKVIVYRGIVVVVMRRMNSRLLQHCY